MNVEELSLSEWDEYLPATGVEVFHTTPALRVLDQHTRGRLRLFGGFKGDNPVALCPVFEQQRRPGRLVVSPPPSMGVHRLGPVLMPNSPKRRTAELVNRRFVEGLLDTLDANTSLTLFRIVCSADYTDPRPFVWRGFDLQPRFTYVLDLADVTPEEAMRPFSKSLRREIDEDVDVTIDVEGRAGAREICESVTDRYDEQDEPSPLQWPFVRDLVGALDDACRIYVARDADGDYLSGMLVLVSDGTAYYWQGGASATHDGVSVNTLLHWRVIRDVIDAPELADVTQYDLVGANTERICDYKRKFGGRLVPYYTVESSGIGMELAKSAYRLVAR
jgi:hypothetical protein